MLTLKEIEQVAMQKRCLLSTLRCFCPNDSGCSNDGCFGDTDSCGESGSDEYD